MQGFKVCTTIDEIELKKFPISGQTVEVGDLLQKPAGGTTWTVCTSASLHYTRKFIAYQATTGTEVLGYEIRGNEKVEAQSTTIGLTADIGDHMVLVDKNTVNNTGINSTAKEAVFVMDEVGNTYGGATTTYSIFGRILVGTGLTPAAA
jgi:hypothetical protein